MEKPAPADIRRFPVSVVSINIPYTDVDFNLETDKSKVQLVNQVRFENKNLGLLSSNLLKDGKKSCMLSTFFEGCYSAYLGENATRILWNKFKL